MNQSEQLRKNAEQMRKNIERARREQKLRRWLTTLSWSTPVIAFTGFFGLWNHVSASSTTSGNPASAAASAGSSSRAVQAVTKPADRVLLQNGSTGPQVSTLQEQLAELGYFNHAVTEYYGPVTSQAVEAFQAAYGLSITGKVDESTLTALSHAARSRSTTALAQSSRSTSSTTSPQSSGQSASSFTQSQSSQQSSPSSLSRAS